MISFQKDIFSPTVEGTKEIITQAESSNKTKTLTQKFRQEHDDKYKRALPAVCYMATFGQSTNDKGVEARWRKQETAHLTGEVVSDFDHLEENPRTLFVQWQALLDFKQEGILKIFVTPSGKGIKVVSKWRKEWGNLAENQLQTARLLGMERYLDASGKDASRTAFVPMRSDVLYEDEEVYTHFDPECDKTLGEAYRSPNAAQVPLTSEVPCTPPRGEIEGGFSPSASLPSSRCSMPSTARTWARARSTPPSANRRHTGSSGSSTTILNAPLLWPASWTM